MAPVSECLQTEESSHVALGAEDLLLRILTVQAGFVNDEAVILANWHFAAVLD